MVPSVSSLGRRSHGALQGPFIRALIPFRGAPPSCPHLVTLASQRPRLLIPSLWRVEFQPMNWGGDADIPSMAMVLFKHLLPQGAPLRKQQAVPDKGIKLAEMGQHHRDSLGHLLTAKCPRTRHRTECQRCTPPPSIFMEDRCV